MSPPRSLRAPLVALLVMTACGEESVTSIPVVDDPAPSGFMLAIPHLEPADLVEKSEPPADRARTPGPRGPARTEGEPDDGPSSEDPADYADEVAQIYEQRTSVSIGPESAMSWGDHWYQGNKGRVETTAEVSSGGARLGSQSAAREDSGMFLVDGPRVKYIATVATVFIDEECGLSVTGSSKHSAWWQWYLGFSVPTWGRAEVPSADGPESQASCSQSSSTGGSSGGSSAVCYFSIDYDLETLEVVSYELLFCTGLEEQIGG